MSRRTRSQPTAAPTPPTRIKHANGEIFQADTTDSDVRRFTQAVSASITPWTASIITRWTIGQIRSALLAHIVGDMGLAGPLLDALLQDDEIPGDLQKRVNATLGSPFHLVPDTDRDLTPVEKEVETDFSCMVPDDELFDLIADWLMLGVAVGVFDWDTSGEIWRPTLRALPAQFLTYHEEEDVWRYEAREGTQIVTPGDGKWVFLTNGQRGQRWGLIRSLATLWLAKSMTLGDWNRYCQKHGLPIIKAVVPLVVDEREKTAFIDDLGAIASEGIIGLPQDPDGKGYDVELLEATDNSWESFQANVERADRKIQILFLGSHISTEITDNGSRAAAETSAKSVDRDKAKSDEKHLSQSLYEQLMVPFFALNYGPGVDVPRPHWDVAPDEDVRSRVQSRAAFVAMLTQMPATGFKLVNAEKLAEEYGLKIEGDGVPAAPAAPEGSAPEEKPPPRGKGKSK